MAGCTKDESLVIEDFMLSNENDYSEERLHTLQCLLSVETSIYSLKVIVEKYSKILRDIDFTNVTGKIFNIHSI